jgi:hypothetical protein
MYDIIGDIHGHYDLLVRMLKKLGYEKKNGVFSHPERKVIFTGDYINRGPQIRETVRLIKDMVNGGQAFAILGNHEFNAILYFVFTKKGKPAKKYVSRLRMPLLKTIEEYANLEEELADTIKWFRELPFYLDLGDIRVIHGGWNDKHLMLVNRHMKGESRIRKTFLKEYLINTELNKSLTELLKGVELILPNDLIIRDQKGISHRNFRIKWWEPVENKTFQDASFSNRFILPPYTIPKEIIPSITYYPDNSPPVFFGHYCLDKLDLIVKNNLCCVDRCVVRSQNLTAYRWNGEKDLKPENLVHLG